MSGHMKEPANQHMHWTAGLRFCFIRASLARASDADHWAIRTPLSTIKNG